jgi:hypothetical protein
MSLIRPAAPPECIAAFTKALPSFLAMSQNGDLASEGYVGALPRVPRLEEIGEAPEKIVPADVQQLFKLGLTDAANNAGVRAATPTGWRVFAGKSPESTVLGVIVQRPQTGWKMTACYYGRRAWDALQSSDTLKDLSEVNADDYQLRILTVPGLNIEAFWLAAQKAGGEHLVVPMMAPALDVAERMGVHGVAAQTVFTMSNFLAAIRPASLAQMNAAPGTGS